MYQNKKISTILLMAGTGARFGSSLPKQYHRISGKKIYLHTLDTFLKMDLIDEVILVCHKDWIETIIEEAKTFPKVKIVEGGKTRQESSYLGIKACSSNTDIVLIHDAVRPFIQEDMIIKNISLAIEHGAVDTCCLSTDTLVQIDKGNMINNIPDRSKMLRGQTPQSFRYNIILKAHENAKKLSIETTDDCSLALLAGDQVRVLLADEYNIKITSELDLLLAEQILRLRKVAPLKNHKTSLVGKVFAIIGGTGDIGSSICDFLKKEQAVAISLSPSSRFPIDLRDAKTIEKAFEKLIIEYGAIDGLINCAGLLKIAPTEKLSLKDIEELISINFTGLVQSCGLAKIKAGGHIINISSSSFTRGRKNYGVYSASKAAVVNFTQALADEKESLFVNVVVPSRTNSRMRQSFFPNEKTENLLEPSQVAKAIIQLLKQKDTGMIVEVK